MKQKSILSTIMSDGIVIKSSGSSGPPKAYYQPSGKVKAANEVARMVQGIDRNSKVYTVMKLDHAGGLFGQTVPAYEVGATVDPANFNPYHFVKNIRKYTHSHITPAHALAILRTKGFYELDLSGITITCGAEPVTWNIIEAFVDRGCKFIVNWGMSEIGPIAINHVFESMEEVRRVKSICPFNATVMGANKYCDYKIVDGELVVKGDICIYDDWYHTKDKVVEIDGILFYLGRTNKEVDFNNPTKGLDGGDT
jgi:acyl-coenzyme A synthetase/AMP-(fatty) acid ligase